MNESADPSFSACLSSRVPIAPFLYGAYTPTVIR